MKFEVYEVLSQVIPGFILLSIVYFYYDASLPKVDLFPSIALAYAIGYFVNTLASWLEDVYYWTWKGKPSINLMQGRDIWKVRFPEYEKVIVYLHKDGDQKKATAATLFNRINRAVDSGDNPKIDKFNAAYASSRAILTCMIIATIIAFFNINQNLAGGIIFLLLTFISWIRTKQRAYYYAREVLNTYLKKMEQMDIPTN